MKLNVLKIVIFTKPAKNVHKYYLVMKQHYFDNYLILISQKVLEEGLETKSKGAPKTIDKSTTNKKKSSAMFCKPYFKDKDQKVFTVDVRLTEEIRIVNDNFVCDEFGEIYNYY